MAFAKLMNSALLGGVSLLVMVIRKEHSR